MFHIYLAFIHEFNQTLDIGECDILHYNYRIPLTRIIREHCVEEAAAGAEHYAMSAYQLSLTGQCHITETATVQEL